MGSADDPIVFGVSLQEIENVRTRADGTDDVSKFESTYIVSDPFGMDFYIQLYCLLDDETKTKLGTYEVPSGYEGKLEAKAGSEPLKWSDLDSDHTFYAWNIPWNDDKNYDENEKWVPELNDEGGLDPITIKFHDSYEGPEGFDKYKNNSIYENFIGAKSVPHSYRKHGRYVDLTFHHLVSKIKIGSFRLIGTDGSIQEHLKADVTFVGMPTEATFYPHPENHGRPCIPTNSWKQSDNEGLTFFIDNDATTEDYFYICPEVDFSKIDFKVKINDEEYKHKDVFYGTFDDVVFKRNRGAAYDQDKDDEGNDIDSKILHAGEMMTLNITLIPGIGPGLSIIIDKWSTDDPKDTPYHAFPGIYSEADVRSLLDAFLNQKNPGQGGTTEDDIKRLFDMYGEEREEEVDGQIVKRKYFPLYENVDISKHTNGNIFPVPDGYILDGMGHTITMKTNRGSNNDFKYTQTYFNIGSARDIWLTDGTNTIYIDAEGYVWIKDDSEPGGYKRTEHKLEPLVDPYKSYDISCETGIVHRSTYYNNNIVGS